MIPCRRMHSARVGPHKETRQERAVRAAVRDAGLHFLAEVGVQVPGLIKGNGATATAYPDLLFCDQGVAVFLDGCYWHGCPDHGKQDPAQAADRRFRSTRVADLLTASGWTVLRLWEHEPTDQCLAHILAALHAATDTGTGVVTGKGTAPVLAPTCQETNA